MNMTRILLLSALVLLLPRWVQPPVVAQENIRIDPKTVAVLPSAWELMEGIDTTASLRGLHVLDRMNIWASGSGGTIVHSADGGKTWKVRIVQGAEELDFRDIHAIDEGTIVAMTSGTPARIYRSTNGGMSWKLCYNQADERVFLDALSFWNDKQGVVMGDPIGDALFLLGTSDGGRTWKQFASAPAVKPGEAGFAASGTNAIATDNQRYFVGLGSAKEGERFKTSRIVFSHDRCARWHVTQVPIPRSQSAGIFGLCFIDAKHGVAVGGDYQKPDQVEGNFAITSDGGQSWTTPNPRQPPSGFRSCVAVSRKNREIRLVTVGTNGTDVSTDLGKKWRRISNEGFHAIDFTNDGIHGWAVGSKGRIARWTNQFDAKKR